MMSARRGGVPIQFLQAGAQGSREHPVVVQRFPALRVAAPSGTPQRMRCSAPSRTSKVQACQLLQEFLLVAVLGGGR